MARKKKTDKNIAKISEQNTNQKNDFNIVINKRVPVEVKQLKKEIDELKENMNILNKLFKNIVQKDNVLYVELNDNVIIKSKNSIMLNEGYAVHIAKEIHLNPDVQTKKILEGLQTSDKNLEDVLEEGKINAKEKIKKSLEENLGTEKDVEKWKTMWNIK